MSDAGWMNLPLVINALGVLIGAIGLFYARIAALRAEKAKKAAEAAKEVGDTVVTQTNAHTATLGGLDKKADAAAEVAEQATGKLEKIGTQTNGAVGELRTQLDTLYQQQIATFRETQKQLLDAWVAQQKTRAAGPAAEPGDVATVANAITEALHATPEKPR